MAVLHRILSVQNKLLPFLYPGSITTDTDSKALDELITLYHPQLDLGDNLTDNDIDEFRYHSKRMLTA
ncbi:unnamed protein product, partial [Rotaria sp. Silwood2]